MTPESSPPAPPRETPDQLEWEAARRPLAARAAVLSGFLMLGAAVAEQFVVFRNYPSVGLLQGLGPALGGQAEPVTNPRIAIIEFLHHHAAGAILWGTVSALATALLAVSLTYLYSATLHRRPETSAAAGRMALIAPPLVGALSLTRLIVLTVTTSHFSSGHDRSRHAIDAALTPGGLTIVGYLAFAASIALAFAVIVTALNAMRAGLLTRMMGVLGILVGVLAVIPQLASPLPVMQALWLISLGVLIAGGWPTGTPAAWAAGEARPWPTSAEQREAREAAKRAREGLPPPETAQLRSGRGNDDDTPAPQPPAHSSSKKRRRKRR